MINLLNNLTYRLQNIIKIENVENRKVNSIKRTRSILRKRKLNIPISFSLELPNTLFSFIGSVSYLLLLKYIYFKIFCFCIFLSYLVKTQYRFWSVEIERICYDLNLQILLWDFTSSMSSLRDNPTVSWIKKYSIFFHKFLLV